MATSSGALMAQPLQQPSEPRQQCRGDRCIIRAGECRGLTVLRPGYVRSRFGVCGTMNPGVRGEGRDRRSTDTHSAVAQSGVPSDRKWSVNVIRFYRESDAYGEFSNFARWPVRIDGQTWPTTEQYFQAQKFAGTPYAEEIRRARGPGVAARLGRTRKRALREDWESVKDAVMHRAVLAKFTQHAPLRELLLGTGDATLVEHTDRDRYWGDGGDGSGKNRLGQILMRVREELRHGAAVDARSRRK